jgi:predicted ArsR family transcriptional regulator
VTRGTRDISAVALLAEPTRRGLYDFVRSKGGVVGRDEAARRLGISRGLAAFHLDRLAGAGLLETEYRRISGRTGPGAGRPAKLYRMSERQVSVILPPTRYDLAGEILARSIEVQGRTDASAHAVGRAAADRGREIGRELGPSLGRGSPLRRTERALAELGFEPEAARGGVIRLGTCPFPSLSRQNPDLVCGLNLALLRGLVAGLEADGVLAEPDPDPTRCCVRLRAETVAP